MQFYEENRRPESNRKFLIKQVEEQSDWCDVTLRIGPWEKKFHGCVLVASPFFDQILKSNFLEKQTGKIEMAIGTPVTLEMAVMFLYGRKPLFTEENIEQMMDLAEFLLIPNLKAACVHWITRLNITEGNCINIIQLSSLYDLYIPECEEYFEGHCSKRFNTISRLT
ncbi:calicin-like isoform X2 [Mercenaria mercenaria]|uniref:calicin-like isoform X2 n=1 Tax=Mercenaria mercenaria TaxID=6596 RepID=UPI00234F7D2E|nr:calicin-like isoform X2 [Mercenaria mercenaria]